MTTFFGKMDPKFPSLIQGNVPSEQFLDATRQLVPFLELLGSAFGVITRDIKGNIAKIQKAYEKDPPQFKVLRGLLEDDIENKNSNNSSSATIALLWLSRTLQFLLILLQQMVEDNQNAVYTENLSPFCRNAYEQTLKNYHSWVTQKVFSMCTKALPNRKDMLTKLAFGRGDLHDLAIQDTHNILADLEANIISIQQTYNELGLKFENKA